MKDSNQKKKMLMLATTAAMIEQFNKNNILILEEMGYEVHVAGNWKQGNPISEERLLKFQEWLGQHHGSWYQISATRKPTDFHNNIVAYKKIVELIRINQYEFIHCHTPIGSVIGRLAAHKTKTKIIYTAHGFHFYKGAPLKNWLLYYPVEWICSWLTDVLITINKEDYERAKKHLHAKRVEYIPGVGIDVERFATCQVDKKEKCKELGIPDDKFILLSVGELNRNKNQGLVIDALYELNNDNVIYLIAGQGETKRELEKKIKNYDLEKSVKLLGYRDDILELYKVADCFIFPSLREGLSVAVMEAMASGLPVICSDIRGNIDLIENQKGGFLFQTNSLEQFEDVINKMLYDTAFKSFAGRVNKENAKKYNVRNCQNAMEQIYRNRLL